MATNPISRKMLRISSRTFSKGCSAPPLGYMPSDSKLYFLKCADFQAPLYNMEWISREVGKGKRRTHDVSISTVRSVSGFAVEVLKFGPFWTVNH